jgi:hypothetical protein
MFNSTLIEVGIGISIIFFVVASIVTAGNEWLTRMLDVRAKILWKAVANIIDHDKGKKFDIDFKESVLWFRNKADARPVVGTSAAGAALSHRLANHHLVLSLGGTSKHSGNRTKVDDIAARTFAHAILHMASQGASDEPWSPDAALQSESIRSLLKLTDGTPLGSLIRSVVGHAEITSQDLVQHISTWFDAQMSRLSSLYKIAARKILFIGGLLLAVGMNISATNLVHDLSTNADARAALLGVSAQLCPSGSTPDTQCAKDVVKKLQADTRAVVLPVVGQYESPFTALGRSDRSVWATILGWLITGCAVSFGAPFWFDIVQKLSGYRKSG